jgi:hypothetical protein
VTAVDDVVDAYIHEADCRGACSACLLQAMAARPVLALPVGPNGRDEAAMAAWLPVAGGRWAAIEQALAEAIIDALDYDHMLYSHGRAWCSHSDTHGEPDVLLVGLTGPEQWTRVRVSVEVLDGVL